MDHLRFGSLLLPLSVLLLLGITSALPDPGLSLQSEFNGMDFDDSLFENYDDEEIRVKRMQRSPQIYGRKGYGPPQIYGRPRAHGADGDKTHGSIGAGAYSKCAGPEGLPGTCKPLASCGQYYGTAAHYSYDNANYYKSCNYGYGSRGVCCPDVYFKGPKPLIINYNPKKYGDYDGKSSSVPPEAIGKAFQFAINYKRMHFDNDDAYGRGEDDPSYWGNGVALEAYNEKVKEYADVGVISYLVTLYLKKEYGYKPESLYGGGLRLMDYANQLPEKYRSICQSYYKKCYPSKYRSFDGSCNNLKTTFYGQSNTAVGRIRTPKYSDGVWGTKVAYGGGFLPPARHLRTYSLPDKNIEEKEVNMMFYNYGQFCAHDVAQVPFHQGDNGKFLDCCYQYKGGEAQVHPKCYAIPIPADDKFYKSTTKETCLNMARAMVGPNHHCAVGYSSQMNHQTAFLDCSLVYGLSDNSSMKLRTGSGGLMRTSRVGDQYYLPIDKDAECFNVSSEFCMASGDMRTTLHPGITSAQIIALRFHNICAKRLGKVNKYWDDEKLYQECRRIVIAVFQHITYTEYLPLALGWRFMYDYGLLPPTKGFSYDYDANMNPWTLAEFTAAAFRLHSSVYGKILLVDEKYNVEDVQGLENHFNSAMLFKNPYNFDKVIRGYIYGAQRKIDEYYDPAVGDLLLKNERKFGLDLPTMNIYRGRDYGLGSYNDYREICGLPRAKYFKDFTDVIEPEIVNRFSKLYKSVEDVELYVGGVAEKHVKDSVLGPTWWCIVGYQFQLWKRADRFFYTEGGQPHSFTSVQLDEIRKISFASLLCTTTGVKEVPAMSFRTISNGNPLVYCSDYEAIPRIDFGVFADNY